MRIPFFLCLVFISFHSFCQDGESKWNLHASVSTQVCYRYIGNESTYKGLNGGSPTGRSIFGYVAALGVSRQLSPNWQIEAGLSINQCGFGSQLNVGLKTNDSSAPGYKDLTDKVKWSTRFVYAGIPVHIHGTFGQGRLRPVFTGGLIFGRLIKATQETETTTIGGSVTTSEKDFTESYHDYSLFLELGFGIEYKLNDTFGLRAIPFGGFGILKLDKEDYNYHLFQGGLQVGGFYRL